MPTFSKNLLIKLQVLRMSEFYLYFVPLLTIWLVLILSVVTRLAPFGLQFYLSHIDFRAFYTGFRLFNSHMTTKFYDLDTQYLYQQAIIPTLHSSKDFVPYFNPPFLALILFPLGLVSLEHAYFIWLILDAILYFMLIYLSFKELKPKNLLYKFIVVIAATSFFPLVDSLLEGQLSIILALVLLFSWISFKKNHLALGGFMLSFLLIKPNLIVLPFLVLLVQRRWRAFTGLSLGITLLSVISLLIVGVDGIWSYYNLLNQAVGWDSQYGISLEIQYNLKSAIYLLWPGLNTSQLNLYWGICFLFLIPLTVGSWYKKYKTTSFQHGIQWIILIITMILISPHTHYEDLSLLFVTGVIGCWIVRFGKISKGFKWFLSLVFCSAYLLFLIKPRTPLHIELIVGYLVLIMIACVLLLLNSSDPSIDNSNTI